MSTIRVNTIQSTSTTDGGISIDSSGNITLPASTKVGTQNLPSAGPLSNRNLIINGAMQVAQRWTSTTGLTGNANGYPADRFRFFTGSLGTWTIEQSTDAPAGFNKSAKMTCTTGASADAGDYVFLEYSAEAQDLQQLDFGASTAEATTLSFYVKSNKTGTGSVEIQQLDNSNEQFVGTYTINSADTWELKTIAIPADTDGVINDDNGTGLRFRFWLNSGTDYSGGSTTTAWTTYGQTNSNISNLGVGGANSDNWAITGVQLEVGSVATPFEHRSYGDELARCQRYYWNALLGGNRSDVAVANGTNWNGTTSFFSLYPPVSMRAIPSIEVSNSSAYYRAYESSGYTDLSTLSLDGVTTPTIIEINAGAGGAQGNAVLLRTNHASAILRFSAEL